MPECSVLAFILLGILLGSWFCGLVSDINLRKFSVIIDSNIFSIPFFSFRYSRYVYITTFCGCPTVLGYSILFFVLVCSLCFSF